MHAARACVACACAARAFASRAVRLFSHIQPIVSLLFGASGAFVKKKSNRTARVTRT